MAALVPISGISADAIENLLDNAFGTDRHSRTAYLLRKGMPVIEHLSFAIVQNETVVGSIQCWPVSVGEAPLILVGPVAVAPSNQHQGLGHRLMRATLSAVTNDDPPMVMIGDPEYYGRFGFSAGDTCGWVLPGPWEPRRLLVHNPRALKLPEKGVLGPRL